MRRGRRRHPKRTPRVGWGRSEDLYELLARRGLGPVLQRGPRTTGTLQSRGSNSRLTPVHTVFPDGGSPLLRLSSLNSGFFSSGEGVYTWGRAR